MEHGKFGTLSTPEPEDSSREASDYGSGSSSESSNSQSQLWPSETVSCYSTVPYQMLESVFFFINGGKAGWTPSATMKITAVGANNNEIPVKMTKENMPFSCSYVCTFNAPTPGCYTVSVCEGLLDLHIKGSPFLIPVSRNYKMSSSWMKPRVFDSQTFKAWGIAYSPSTKRIFVTDRDTHQIIIYHENGTLDKCFGEQGHNPSQLSQPTGIAVDNHNQRLVITDKNNHRVSIYSLDGQYLFSFGSKGDNNGQFNYPWGVSVSPKKDIIAIADSRNHRLQIFDSNGNFLRKCSVFGTNPFEFKTEFNYPRGVSFDKNGENIYVTDFSIHAVFKLNTELTERRKITPHGVYFNGPQGITIDAVGNLLVCDCRNNYIRVLSPRGEHISSILGHSTDSFQFPQDVTVMPTGEIIVVDAFSNVRVL